MEALKQTSTGEFLITDEEIIKRVLSGQKELYEILMRRNNQKLYRVIRSYLRASDEIEDVMQNTYLKAYEKIHQFRETATFSTWLIRIGINEALGNLRGKGKHLHISDQSLENIIEMPDLNQLNPERRIIRQEAKKILEDAIDQLDPKYKAVYILREVEGLSITEISECLNMTDSNVKVRLHRAKQMIKEELYELSLSKDIFEFGSSRCDMIVKNVLMRI